ncbi:hypothetical protein [Actinoplanes sp. NPDC051494]|uniref:hypothetical protein n=1 Tax=Actinoplanes sp. NPDC051494 TaxID=3363907 RepID=UPI0037A0B5D0
MKKIMSFGAVLIAGLLASGCANSQAAGSPAAPADLEQGRELFEQVRLSLFGSAADRLAAEKVVAARFQGALATCMQTKGFTYHQAPSEQQNGGPVSPGDLASITEIGAGDFGIATAKLNQAKVADQLRAMNADRTMTPEQEAAYGKALGNCTSAASEVQEVALPSQSGLTKELTAIFREVEKMPAVADAGAAYGPCMSQAEVTTTSYFDIYQQALDKFPRADMGVTSMEQDPQWATAVAFEKKAATADARCRQPMQDQALAAAADDLQAYVTKNRAKLDAASAGWAVFRS